MWFFKKDPLKKIQKEYEDLLEDAMYLQRSGKIPEFAKKTAEAEVLLKEIERLRKEEA